MNTDDTLELFMKRLTDAQPNLERFVTAALVAHTDDVRDIVQNTNYKLIAHARDYRPDCDFLPWAIAFAKNEILAYRKKQERERLVFDDTLLDTYEKSAFDDTAKAVDDSLRIQALYSCLRKLPARERGLISDHYLKENPLVRLAAREHRPESTLRVTLFRARQALADCMKRFCRLNAGKLDTSGGPTAFSDLLTRAIDSEHPNPDAVAALLDSLRAHPADMSAYADQLDIHFLLTRQANALGIQQAAPELPVRTTHSWLKAAALLAALLASLAYAYHAVFSVDKNSPAQKSSLSIEPIQSSPAAITAVVPTNTQGETEVKTNTLTREVAAALALSAVATPPLVQSSGATDVRSAGTRMVFAPETNSAWSIYWQTAFTNVVPICWDACPKAASAHLAASCMNVPAETADFSPADTNAVWRIPAGTDEDIYTIELRYLNAGGDTLLAVTSRVARIRGVNKTGAAMDLAATDETNTEITAWSRIRRPGATVDNTVIAYDTAWYTTNSIGSAVFTAKPLEFPDKTTYASIYAQAGYIGWQLAGQGMPVGWYAVSLEFDDGTLLYQKVYRSPGGTIYSFR